MKALMAKLQDIEPRLWRSTMLEVVLRASLLFGLVVYVPSVYMALRDGLIAIVLFDTVAVALVAVLIFGKRIAYRIRAWGLCLVVYGLGTILLIWVGSVSQIYLLAFSVLTTLLLGLRAGLVTLPLTMLTMLAIGYAGLAVPALALPAWLGDFAAWTVVTLNFGLVNLILVFATGGVLIVTERALAREIAAREDLQRERSLLRTIIDTTPEGIGLMNAAGTVQEINAAGVAIFQLDIAAQVIGRRLIEFVAASDRAAFSTLHAGLREGTAGRHIFDLAAGQRTIEILVAPLPLSDREPIDLFICRDITETRRLGEQLLQSQKMEAIGQLAGGIAHDFNNLLTVIIGNGEFVLERQALADEDEVLVRDVLEAGQRAAALTRQLLAFGRKQMLDARVLDLNEVVRTIDRLLRRLLGADIDVECRLDPMLWPVRVDAGQIEQVILNLALNARDAMPGGGRLIVGTGNASWDEEYCASHADRRPGHYATIAITDSGVGMSAETRSRLFEPFYTTKALGHGTGLGLAVVHGIVRQSNGFIDVCSEPDCGTTFRLFFPAVLDSDRVDPPASTSTVSQDS